MDETVCFFILVEEGAFRKDDLMDNENNFVNSSVTELTDDTQEEEMLMLCEDDIPGASLNGRDPNELTVVQLKRWLACRGAPLSGKTRID